VIALPWFLLAIGIGIVILGFLLASLPGLSGRGDRPIDPRMRDDEIIRKLDRAQRMPLANFVILAGLVCILVSICWRVARLFL
jgi:hypothetical protein